MPKYDEMVKKQIQYFQQEIETQLKKFEHMMDKNNKNSGAERVVLFNLASNLVEIDRRVPDQNLKLKMMQQALINAYYALRRMEGFSLNLFGSDDKIADQLERLINENVRYYGGVLKIPHRLKSGEETVTVFNRTAVDGNTEYICQSLRRYRAGFQTDVDDLVLKIYLAQIDPTSTVKEHDIAQLLVNKYFELQRNQPGKAENLTSELKSLLENTLKIPIGNIDTRQPTPSVQELIPNHDSYNKELIEERKEITMKRR
jgi:RNase H-fold protein (predicted Holliday junction resolvase)